jgi:excisionase family DNA binding protein
MSALNTNTQSLTENSTLQVIHNHITVQEASVITGYNAQYLRRILRAGKLDAIKIGQIWLVNLTSLQAYFSSAISSNDMRFGPKGPWQPPF